MQAAKDDVALQLVLRVWPVSTSGSGPAAAAVAAWLGMVAGGLLGIRVGSGNFAA